MAVYDVLHINGLVQDCRYSSALEMVLLQSCTKPWIWLYFRVRLTSKWQSDNRNMPTILYGSHRHNQIRITNEIFDHQCDYHHNFHYYYFLQTFHFHFDCLYRFLLISSLSLYTNAMWHLWLYFMTTHWIWHITAAMAIWLITYCLAEFKFI